MRAGRRRPPRPLDACESGEAPPACPPDGPLPAAGIEPAHGRWARAGPPTGRRRSASAGKRGRSLTRSTMPPTCCSRQGRWTTRGRRVARWAPVSSDHVLADLRARELRPGAPSASGFRATADARAPPRRSAISLVSSVADRLDQAAGDARRGSRSQLVCERRAVLLLERLDQRRDVEVSEGATAPAAAECDGRIYQRTYRSTVSDLRSAGEARLLIGIDRSPARHAVELADYHRLRGYDAVHMPTALAATAEVVLVTWDRDLARDGPDRHRGSNTGARRLLPSLKDAAAT